MLTSRNHPAETAAVELRPDEFHTTTQWDVFRGETFLGVVMDEGDWGQTRGRFAAWSSKGPAPRGVVGFFNSAEEARDAITNLWPSEAPATSENVNDPEGLAVEAAPERRTLKGVNTPFRVFGTEQAGGRIWCDGNPKMPAGQLYTVVRTETRGGCRYGYLQDGTEIDFIGTARKVWILPGA